MKRAPGVLAWGAIIAATALLVAGIAELFRLRFARGDVYPAYSTMRTDPLGSRVLHDALDEAGITVTRNFTALKDTTFPEATLYFIGTDWHGFTETKVEQVQPILDAVQAGARLVVAFQSYDANEAEPRRRVLKNAEPSGNAPPPAEPPTDTSEPETESEPVTVAVAEPAPQRLMQAFELGRLADTAVKLTRDDAVANPDAPLPGPGTLTWHSQLRFAPKGEAWRVRYTADGHPVVLDRDFGRGTIVLFGDAYWMSNEAMRNDRLPALLAWLHGGHRVAVFDESHLGVHASHGVASLARRYGLEHTVFVLVVVALLFIWRNRSSLVPVTADPDALTATESNVAVGRDSAAGFVNLLRRALPARELYPAMLTEFLRSRAAQRVPDATRRALSALDVPAAAQAPLDAIRRAHALLKRKH